MPPSSDELRRVLGHFATGVTIVTTRVGDELHGMTANAVTSVSLEPPLVLVCVDRAADSHDILAEGGVFAVNVLSLEQEALAVQFARKEGEAPHRLEDVPHRSGVSGAPIIDGCIAYVDCRVTERLPGGDHTIFLGEVLDAGTMADSGPLLFYQGRFLRLA